jgi:hypothetical protein
MIQRFAFLLTTLLLTALIAPPVSFAAEEPAQAEEKTPEQKTAEEASPMKASKEDPELAKQEKQIEDVYKLIDDLVKGLEEREQKHFYMMYSNYNLIATVEMVQGDVANAVKECGKNNPDMKEVMDTRFGDWKSALKPVLEEAHANVNNMLEAQEYAKTSEIKKIFKQLDKTRVKVNNQVEKIPVTTPEACDYLRNKMDETQDSMLSILKSTLVSFPQAFPEDDQEEQKDEAPAEDAAPKDL